MNGVFEPNSTAAGSFQPANAHQEIATGEQDLEPVWPIGEWRRRDLFFYNEAIESYQPGHRVAVAAHGEMLLLGSYSYLGLNGHPKINAAAQAAIEQYGTGTHGVRLLSGTLDIHRQLEARVARFKKTESAITFSSGYAANISTISTPSRQKTMPSRMPASTVGTMAGSTTVR